MLYQFLRTGHGIAFNQMFAMTDYPPDIMPLYAQGYSLAEFLIQTGGRRKYVEFLGDGLQSDDWPGAVERHYGVKDLGALQNTWLAWVEQGSPLLKRRDAPPAAGGRNAGRQRAPAAARAELDLPRPRQAVAGRGRRRGWRRSTFRRRDRTPSPAVAGNVPRSAPKVLPASGWHAAGESAPAAVASRSEPPQRLSSPTQVARPQPPEEPPQRVLR